MIRGAWDPFAKPAILHPHRDSSWYEYDVYGNRLSSTFYVLDGQTGRFFPLGKESYTYDSSNRVQLMTEWGRDTAGNMTIELGQWRYSYGNGGVADSLISQRRDATTGNWLNGFMQTSKYNSRGELLEWRRHRWNNNRWEPTEGEKFIRSGLTNGMFHEEIYQVYLSNSWSDYRKTENTFAEGRVVERITYTPSNGIWVNSSRRSDYIYGNGTHPEHLDVGYTMSVWSKNTWVESSRYRHYTHPDRTNTYVDEVKTMEGTWRPYMYKTVAFNEMGQLLHSYEKDERISAIRETWDTLTYDTDGTLLERRHTSRQPGLPFFSGSEYSIYGNFITVSAPTAVPKEQAVHAVLYPNPTQQFLHIEPQNATGKPIVVEAHNTKGILLFRQEFQEQEKVTIDLGTYPAGLYYIRITTGITVRTHKVLKQ